ncbi:MAG: hypothetical protein WEA99_03030 [Brumimicrobium sp.]
MDSKFFSFIKPYLSFIDSGNMYRKPFSWLYTLLAILNLLFPIFILYEAIDGRIFESPAKIVVVFILLWIVIAFAGWLSFQLWWDRKSKVLASSTSDDEFSATPVFSHFIQTYGEWFGTWLGIVGFTFALLSTIFLGNEGGYMARNLGLGFVNTSVAGIFLMPIFGFLIIVVSRFVAEQFRALTAIANNTKKH